MPVAAAEQPASSRPAAQGRATQHSGRLRRRALTSGARMVLLPASGPMHMLLDMSWSCIHPVTAPLLVAANARLGNCVGSADASCSGLPSIVSTLAQLLDSRALPCSRSALPLEPLQNRPPREEIYLEDGAAGQADAGVVAGADQRQAGTAGAVIPADPPPAHKLASVELIPRTDPVFRPVRAVVHSSTTAHASFAVLRS